MKILLNNNHLMIYRQDAKARKEIKIFDFKDNDKDESILLNANG